MKRMLVLVLSVLTIVAGVNSVVCAYAEDVSGDPVPLAMNADVLDTMKEEQCQTTGSHNWSGDKRYRLLTFNKGYELARRDVARHWVDYPCHYQKNHKASHTVWKYVYRTW